MKLKKLWALLLALSMLATTVATTSVFASGTDDELVDIASTATMSTNGNDEFWNVSNANDGNIETAAGIYNATEDSYIQADFGHTQDIKSITVTNANVWGWTGTGKARIIRLSNDPNFTTYEEMVCVRRINEENGESNANSDYVDYKSEWSYAGDSSYRYVRIYPTPAAASYTNWGTDTTPSFAIKELDVFATKQSADLVNVIAGKTPTLTNGDWRYETTGANLVDGNNGTVAYASGTLAVFELDHHMDIDRVEIDLRADGEITDADRHYEVYLSNTGGKEDALKVLGVEENHQQIGLNTIVLPVDSNLGYKYVLVGSESNFWGLTEVRAMSTGEYVSSEKPSEVLVNVAEGKVVYSSKFGMGSWDGGPNTADTLVDGGKGIYVSPLAAGEEDVITIDLLGDYTVKNVQIETYGNDDPSDDFYVGDGGGFYVVAKKTLDDAGIELERKMNGDSGYFPVSSGGHISEFITADGEKYRYIDIHYIEGENAVDMRMPEVKVHAPASEAANSKKLAPVSFGKSVIVGQDPTWGAVTGFTDARKTGDNPHYWLYNATDGQAWVIIDLGCAYPIEMVIPDMQLGEISDVIVSNNTDFADETYLIDENGQWTIEDGEDNMYRYVKIVPTVVPSSASDTTPSTSYWEVVVYSTPEAKEANASLVNIKSTATMSSSLEAGAFDPWPIAQATDGNLENTAGIYNATEDSYIQADFGHTQDIKSITVTNANVWGWTGTGKARIIQLSNDPNFTTYEEMVCVQRINEENGETNANSAYVDYKSEWLYAGNTSYRYARIYPTPAAASYTNWGSDTMPSFAIKELDVFATKQSADLVNVIAGKTPTLTNGDWMFETTGANLTDGNNGTVAYATGTLAVFELDQYMDIEKVEIDLRADGEVTDADRHYEVYLSNTGTKEDALKVLGVEENHQQIGLNTIVLPVDSDAGYKYVLVGSESNFWGLTEVRAMSTGEYATPEIYGVTSELAGEQTKGSVLTLSTSYTLKESINKTVNLYIARYDNKQLTDFAISYDVIFDGKSGEASLEYTITDDVTAQTQFKGFVWEKATLAPFAPVAEKKKYNEFWVDPNALVNGDGSKASPFNSLNNARDAVRTVIPSMEDDIVINLKGGTYRTDNDNYFVLGNADGGANGYNVIWKNAPGEKPVISGSKPVTGFTEGDNGIWYADASEFDSIYALTVNGKAARIAGTEEPIHATKLYNGSALTGGYTGGIGFSKNDLPEISNASNAFVHVASSWVDVMYTVDSVSVDGDNYKYVVDSDRLESSTTKELFSSNSIAIDKDDYFYVENAKELLDNPGEFYFGDGVLYYMPRIGEDMTSATVEAAVSDYLINILGDRNNHVQNIVISGIKFENATYDYAYANGFTTRQAQVVNFEADDILVQGSIWLDYADNIEISDCEFTSITKPCISFVQGVLNSKVTRNKFSNIGSSAVVVGTNDHNELEYESEERCAGNTISDNIIENPAMIFRGSPAISCYYVADTDIVHNKITNCNYTGISLGWGWANYPDLTYCANNKVANNYIENINMIASDGGAIYTLGNLPNAVIEGNYYVQTKTPQQNHILFGLYFDEGTQNVTATNNVIDMARISASGGELYAISAWTDTIKNVTATGNYATFTDVQNDGTNCTIETPTAYTAGSEPAAVQEIIAASAMDLE